MSMLLILVIFVVVIFVGEIVCAFLLRKIFKDLEKIITIIMDQHFEGKKGG